MRRIIILMWFLVILFVTFIFHPYSWCAEDPLRYPSKPITHIVPTPPGGGADLITRMVIELTARILNNPIIAENKGGGDGLIAMNALARSSPDGYTIGTGFPSPFVFLPQLREVPFKPKEDFDFIIQIAEYQHAFVVHRDAPWKSWKDFVEDARKRPGEIKVAAVGVGERIFMRRIADQEKIKYIIVPYRSNAEQLNVVLGRHVDGGIIASIAPHILAGSVRALAVDIKRWEIIPDVPSFQELGFKFDRPRWLGVVAPKGVPENILKKLENAFMQACNDPAYQEHVKRLYMRPVFLSGTDLRRRIFEEIEEQGKMLKTLDLGLEKK